MQSLYYNALLKLF